MGHLVIWSIQCTFIKDVDESVMFISNLFPCLEFKRNSRWGCPCCKCCWPSYITHIASCARSYSFSISILICWINSMVATAKEQSYKHSTVAQTTFKLLANSNESCASLNMWMYVVGCADKTTFVYTQSHLYICGMKEAMKFLPLKMCLQHLATWIIPNIHYNHVCCLHVVRFQKRTFLYCKHLN